MSLMIIRLPEVKERVGLSRSSIYSMMDKGDFPSTISLGGRAVGWLDGEINDWIESRIELSRGGN